MILTSGFYACVLKAEAERNAAMLHSLLLRVPPDAQVASQQSLILRAVGNIVRPEPSVGKSIINILKWNGKIL